MKRSLLNQAYCSTRAAPKLNRIDFHFFFNFNFKIVYPGYKFSMNKYCFTIGPAKDYLQN